MAQKESVGRGYCQSFTRHRQTPNPEIEQPTPHAEAYISLTHLYRGWENTSTAKAFLVASKSLRVENWRFSITGLEAKRFQINMSVMHTTIHHAAQKPHTPTQKGINGSKAHSKCNMHPQI